MLVVCTFTLFLCDLGALCALCNEGFLVFLEVFRMCLDCLAAKCHLGGGHKLRELIPLPTLGSRRRKLEQWHDC